MSTLVVAAHPDDEVLGCGGTMARLTAAGEVVDVLILGEGATSRGGPDDEAVAQLGDDSRRAADVLGVRDVVLGGLPDNRMDSLDLLDVVKRIEVEIEARRPSTVYTHHAGDVNVDHRVTFEAVLAATRPQPGHPVREVLTFEVGSSTEWGFGTLGAFTPSVFVDITDHVDAKADALACYTEELRDFPHPRSIDGIRAQAATRGVAAGMGAAEGFVPVRLLR